MITFQNWEEFQKVLPDKPDISKEEFEKILRDELCYPLTEENQIFKELLFESGIVKKEKLHNLLKFFFPLSSVENYEAYCGYFDLKLVKNKNFF